MRLALFGTQLEPPKTKQNVERKLPTLVPSEPPKKDVNLIDLDLDVLVPIQKSNKVVAFGTIALKIPAGNVGTRGTGYIFEANPSRK
jgi:hypothetical protein